MPQYPKILLLNRPFTSAEAQYSMNTTTEMPAGILEGNVEDQDSELYTLVSDSKMNIGPITSSNMEENDSSMTNGRLWNWKNAEMKVTHAQSYENNAETDGGRYVGVKFAIYTYDGSHPSGSALYNVLNGTGDGNDIRNALGTGNSFDQTDAKSRIGFWDKGTQKQDKSIGNIVTEDKAHYSGTAGPTWVLGGGIDGTSDLIVRNFPVSSNVGSLKMESFNINLNDWTDALAGKYTGTADDYIIFVFRQSSDERETIWPFGTKTDERDRSYTIIGIKKSGLYNDWKNQVGATITIDTDTLNNTLYKVLFNKYDDYGGGRGHSGATNTSTAVNFWGRIKLKITAPTWSPTLAEKDISDGGFNAKWANYTSNPEYWYCLNDDTKIGLNPNYTNIDFVGFPAGYYSGTDGKYFNVSNTGQYEYVEDRNFLFNWRPITYIETFYENNVEFNQDIQVYFEMGTENNALASGPNTIKLSIDIAKDITKYNLDDDNNIINLTNGTANNFDWYLFVVNWDWKDGEPGGGDCDEDPNLNCLEEIGETFPKNEDDLNNLKNNYDTFKLIDIKAGGSATHFYGDSGVRVIKAIVVQTIISTKDGNLKQAIRWKLITSSIHLSSERSMSADFVEVGGSDFTYLPYPDRISTDVETESSTDDYPEYYKISYPVISGLHENSTYIRSLQSIISRASMVFDRRESTEKALALKSLANSPGKGINEYGRYLGNSDIEQIRYFNSGTKLNERTGLQETFDLRTMLDIITVYEDNYGDPTLYYPPNNINFWDGNNNSFPMESIVGSIFINDDVRGFENLCLFEFNCGIKDGNTIQDSSGNGCKGILIGDYSIKKLGKNQKTIRDSYIVRPEVGNSKGAL